MNALYAFFFEPLQYEVMQQAMLIAVLVCATCAVLSCYLILKGWSLMGDAVSHAVLPGIILAYVVGLPLAVGAFAAGLFCALATGFLKDHSRVKEDTVMGVVFSGMFALGVVLYTKIETDQHLDHILFGNLLGVRTSEMIEMAVTALIVLSIVIVKRRDLLLYCFDPEHARTINLPVTWLHYGLLILLSLTIVASIRAVGIILVVAMLIAPGAIGFLVTSRFDKMLAIAVASASISAIVGALWSFHIDAATGPAIILVQSALFLVAFVVSRRRADPQKA